MGKSTRKKQAERDVHEKKIVGALSHNRHKFRGQTQRGIITASKLMTRRLRLFSDYHIRELDSWRYTGKSKDTEKQRRMLVRHLFAKYPVPQFFEDVLVTTTRWDEWENGFGRDTIEARELQMFGQWYITAAQGGSLYKTCTREHLSKKETHWLLQAPNNLDIKQAVWWAKSMAITDDIGIAGRIAHSPFPRYDWTNVFWIDVHRFFVNNPVQLKEMEELLDYIRAECDMNQEWTIKKRSLQSIQRKSEEWHRAQIKMQAIGGGSWDGMDINDWHYAEGRHDPSPHKSSRIDWFVKQIKTGSDLAKEGQRMRHCVVSYKRYCMTGQTAIFSMTSTTPKETGRRNLTLEVNAPGRRIVQARGFANRLPRPEENRILKKWANARRLRVNTFY